MDFFRKRYIIYISHIETKSSFTKLKLCSATEIIKNLENWNKSTLKAASSNGAGQTVQTSVLSRCVCTRHLQVP